VVLCARRGREMRRDEALPGSTARRSRALRRHGATHRNQYADGVAQLLPRATRLFSLTPSYMGDGKGVGPGSTRSRVSEPRDLGARELREFKVSRSFESFAKSLT